MRLTYLTSFLFLVACSTAEQSAPTANKGAKSDAAAPGAQAANAEGSREVPGEEGPPHGDPQGMSHQGPIAFAAAPVEAKVSFTEPADGATVSSPVHLVFHVEGMKVSPAGNVMHGEGHHHVIVDRESYPAAEGIPVGEEGIYHFGKGQLETELELAPGSHTLTLQFADGIHRSFGPELSSTIRVTVDGEEVVPENEPDPAATAAPGAPEGDAGAAPGPAEPAGDAAAPAGTPE